MRFKDFLKHPALQVGKMPAYKLQEADFDDGIAMHMKNLGYKKLGSGVDQMAFEEPKTGEVIKIFGYTYEGDGSHHMFETWARYCKKNHSNPFLPKFGGWKKFHFEDETYIQIRMERLIELPNELGLALENLARILRTCRDTDEMIDEILNLVGEDSVPSNHKLLTHNHDLFGSDMTEINKLAILLGKDFKKFLQTLANVIEIGDDNNFEIDLHAGNFMHRYDGHPVIVDPWVS
jgi:hypothetical protein